MKFNEGNSYAFAYGKGKPKLKKGITFLRSNALSGVECHFIPVSRKSGIKIYVKKRQAKYALRKQLQAYKHNLAPKVMSPFVFQCCFYPIFNVLDLKHGYFYVTEIAPKSKGRTSPAEWNKFENRIEKAHLKTWDLHAGNVKRMRDGRLVMIDFGEEST